jgi:hypothetical protein
VSVLGGGGISHESVWLFTNVASTSILIGNFSKHFNFPVSGKKLMPVTSTVVSVTVVDGMYRLGGDIDIT